MDELLPLIQGGGSLGILALVAWAELRVLPRVRRAELLLERVAAALGVHDAATPVVPVPKKEESHA